MEKPGGSVLDGVFQKFLDDMEKAEVDPEVRERLRKTLLEDRKYSDPVLRRALFGDTEAQ